MTLQAANVGSIICDGGLNCNTPLQVKIQGQNEEMLQAACQQFLGKKSKEVAMVAQETLEGHQRAIMGNMTVEVPDRFKLFLSP